MMERFLQVALTDSRAGQLRVQPGSPPSTAALKGGLRKAQPANQRWSTLVKTLAVANIGNSEKQPSGLLKPLLARFARRFDSPARSLPQPICATCRRPGLVRLPVRMSPILGCTTKMVTVAVWRERDDGVQSCSHCRPTFRRLAGIPYWYGRRPDELARTRIATTTCRRRHGDGARWKTPTSGAAVSPRTRMESGGSPSGPPDEPLWNRY